MVLATKQQSPTLNINKRRSFGVISEPAYDRWITLDSFHHGPDNLFFDQNTPLTLDMHWPSLHAVYSPRAYRMPHLPAVARHTASPAIKKPSSRQSKYSHRPRSGNLPTVFPPSQSGWHNRTVERPFENSRENGTLLGWVGQGFPQGHTYSKSEVLFSESQAS